MLRREGIARNGVDLPACSTVIPAGRGNPGLEANVAACTGIAVPVPGSAHVFGSLDGHGGVAFVTQALHKLESGEASLDHHDVEIRTINCVAHEWE